MSEVESAATQLKTQYAAQVAADLERNTKEQERIGAEVAALEEQLRGLRHDQTLLAELQRALGGEGSVQAAPAADAAEETTASGPSVPRQASAGTARRKKAAGGPATGKTAKTGAKTAATGSADGSAAAKTATKSASRSGTSASGVAKSTAPKSAASKSPSSKPGASKPAARSAAKPASDRPTLVDLIREHLGRQSEPRSSAEVATALAEAHPDREIKPKVVRTTVEGLVAKGQVQRTKQGSSVFYTASAPAPAPAPAPADDTAQSGTEQAAGTA
ncbi:BlaI/MecI/CopY family transcriptional regulator [Streptomyces sp. MMBL 11-3]|uniref:BlaI/MecI/CopY family transcriptional regulator n=1 Tax=Streptomyces sp. MMBL 11-3 TaxID=3382639 RepID=UPI0039B6DBFB